MNGEKMSTPRLTLGHSTLAARDLDRLSTFYCDVLGFHVTHRGPVGDDGAEFAARERVGSESEFQTMLQWQAEFAKHLETS
jgi:catechol 2,3-dioxygenase-like lactoylglutathione lyase family enzyme